MAGTIQNSFVSSLNLPDNNIYPIRTSAIPYGQVDSTSTSTNFTATVPGIYSLQSGVCMWLKNGVVTSASGFTLNINGLGEKPVYNNLSNATRDTTIFNTAYTMFFVYDEDRVTGGCWICYRGYDANTIGEYAGACTAGPNGMARYSLIMQVEDDLWESLVLTSSTAATKTKNSSGFLITSPILYQNGGTYASGTTTTYSQCWSIGYNFDTRYSCNCTSSWSVAGNPLYLIGTISNKKFYLKDTTWWDDALPTTEDGYYYWYVGQMADAYHFSLHPNHPIFYYKNGQIKTYSTQQGGYWEYNRTNDTIELIFPN